LIFSPSHHLFKDRSSHSTSQTFPLKLRRSFEQATFLKMLRCVLDVRMPLPSCGVKCVQCSQADICAVIVTKQNMQPRQANTTHE